MPVDINWQRANLRGDQARHGHTVAGDGELLPSLHLGQKT